MEVAWRCREALEKEGISISVINLHTIKPLDEACVRKMAIRCGAVATLEDHSVIGGLGDAVCSALPQGHPLFMEKIGIEDEFGQSGSPEALLDAYGLSIDKVLPRLRALIARSREAKK